MAIVIHCNNKDPLPWMQKIQEKLPDVDVYLPNGAFANETIEFAICWKPRPNVLLQYPNLAAVQSLGASVDHVLDTQQLGPGISIARIVDPKLSEDMWEFVLAATMAYLKDFPIYSRQQQGHLWKQHHYRTIPETTVSVLGLGQIGLHVANKLAALGFHVQGWSRTEKAAPGVTCFSGEQSLEGVLRTTDVLVNLLPLTKETRGLLDAQALSLLPRGAYLINVGRGEHVVEEDFLTFLHSSHLAGAALDVFETEPLPEDHPFWSQSNVVITPHVAGLTNLETAVEQVVENYQRVQRGDPLLNVVSQARGY